MSTKNRNHLLEHAFEAFTSAWALQRIFAVGPGNILVAAVFVLLLFFYAKQERAGDKRSRVCADVLAAVFAVIYCAYDYGKITDGLSSGAFRAGIFAVTVCGLFIMFRNLLLWLFHYTTGGNLRRLVFQNDTADSHLNELKMTGESVYRKHPFLITFFICLVCMIPCFLYEYPGIMTPDSINQLKQVIGLSPLSNHHPLIHTMIIAIFYKPAFALTHSMTAAIGFYTFAQMCLMALADAYCVNTINKMGARRWVIIVSIIFFVLVPYNWVYAVSMWKDVLFAAAVMMFTASLVRIFYVYKDVELNKQNTCKSDNEKDAGGNPHNTYEDVSVKRNRMTYALQFISCLGMSLLRSNGWYMLLGLLPFMAAWVIVSARRGQTNVAGRLATIWFMAFIIATVIKYPVFSALDVEEPDFIESCSVPAQQIAYVLTKETDVPAEDMKLLSNVIDTDKVGALYAPGFADNIKELVRAGHEDYLTQHKGEFLGLWIRLGIRYPADYLKAYGDETYGYWFPDRNYTVADNEDISDNELGLTSHPLIPARIFLKLQEVQIKLGDMIPLYSSLWCMGAVVWLYATGLGIMLIEKRYRDIIMILPGLLGLFTILIATPVAYDFRYLYFLIYCIPLYFAVVCHHQ